MAKYGSFRYGQKRYKSSYTKINWTKDDYYNYYDLNRVEYNTYLIASYLSGLGYNIPNLAIRTDRDETSIEFLSSINRLEQNIKTVQENFINISEFPSPKTWKIGNGFNNTDANRFDNNLYLLFIWSRLAKDNLNYCGTFTCGEEVVLSG